MIIVITLLQLYNLYNAAGLELKIDILCPDICFGTTSIVQS